MKPSQRTQNARLESLLISAAEQYPDRLAIAEWGTDHWLEIDYQTVFQKAQQFAEQLRSHNIKSGERVLLLSHNRIQAIIALFGIWLADATAVLIDPELPEAACMQQCRIADARFIISEKENIAKIEKTISADYFIIIYDDQLEWKKQTGTLSKTIDHDCDSQIATLLFTSGTTGDYKAVMLTHSNFMYLTQFHADSSMRNGCSLSVLPMFHVAGLFCGFLQPLFLKTKIVVFRHFSVDALQEAFQRYRPTVLILVPRLLEVFDQKIQSSVRERGIFAEFIFYLLLNTSYFLQRFFGINSGKLFFHAIQKKFGGELKKIFSGSAQLPSKLQKHFLSYGFELLSSYGLTETCGPITVTKPTCRWKLGTVGECVNKKDLKITKKSEIIYQGPALMRGYFRDMAATEVAIHDGYLHTQDLGRLDRSGNLFIIGRTKELIVFSDGKKAMPEQIEKQYAEIEGIKEFAVFGVSSTAYQDTSMAVIAYVVAEKHDHKITTQALFQHASRLKSPYRISDVFVVDKIPRSSTLKIKRYELASHYLEGKKSTRLKNNVSKKELSEIIVCFQSLLIDKKECITPDISFAELGIDSLLAAQLCVALNEKLGLSLSPTAFWFSRSIHELHDYVYKKKTTVVQENSTDLQNKHNHIAIISVDCVFPGATNTDTFWKNLCDSKDAIIETPSSRWNNDDYYDAYALAPGKTNSREGGFIQLPTDFPCEKFGLKPRVAQALDPQQKILLMSVQRLLETTNHQKKIENWQGSNTGFFLGVGFPDFLIQTFKTTKLEQVNPYHGIGTADFSSVGRIAYHFGLEGPAMLIKTACSSALVAVHQAIRALQAGDCNAAIAGGINMILIPEFSVTLTKAGFLSPDGRCKSFDANANGYVRSEGCGLVLLKRYNDALRDGDKILSVIMGSSINQDGTSNGLATPNGKSQINCYKAALNNAKLSPEEIGFIEAHGSGTQLGDAIEMQSIQAVYDQDRSSNNPLYVGAVKSAIGHCESAAGIAGLIKTMHVLNHQLIPPNLHYHTPNPNISFAHSAVKLPLKLTRFSHPCEYAAVSSFGVAGTNAHMILKKA